MEPEVTFGRACAIHADWFYGRAADSTVEALMLSLRAGVGALGRADTLRRLSELSKAQLREVAVRLQKFKPQIAPAWTPEQVEALAIVRSKLCHER